MLGLLSTFLLQAEKVTASWELYSEEHTDLDGWPYDQADYDDHQEAKDMTLWHLFTPVREGAASLLDAAEATVQSLSGALAQNRWDWQLTQLRGALEHIDAAQDQFLERLATDRGTGEAVREAVAERGAKASEVLSVWVSHGRAVLEIHASTVRAGQSGIRLAARTTRAPAPAPSSPARRSR
ncbi:hypothetical protein ACFVP0_10045 [Streptomyces cinereoruber]|uniref:hypothetical protein n=1 Tax=Streptomyces cinereoruber TaxID=67260 RepID=UPI0036CFA070